MQVTTEGQIALSTLAEPTEGTAETWKQTILSLLKENKR